MGPDEKQIRQEIKERPRKIDMEEIWVLPSGETLNRPRFQATIENAYLQEVRNVEARTVAQLEERCGWWFDRWDELEVKRRTFDAEILRGERAAEQHARRLYEFRAQLDQSFSGRSFEEFRPFVTGDLICRSRYEFYAMELKVLIEHVDECRELFDSLVREAEEGRVSWKVMAERLGTRWENDPRTVPWFSPRNLDARRAALELLRLAWPLRGWREGIVDQSELHISVRSGGTEIRDNEPEGIDIAAIGPDENEQLIVEFLPMIGVDPEAGQAAKNRALSLLDMVVRQGRGNPWRYAQHHCGTGANMYSRVRFVPRGGREPTRNLKSGTYTETEFVRKQLGRVEHLEQWERLRFFEAYDAVAFELTRESGAITGYLMQLTHDSLAVELSTPTRTGCMIRNVRSRRERRYLIDADGGLNDFGIQKLVQLVNGLQTAVDAMEDRIADIQAAAETVLKRSKSTDKPHDDDEYVMQIWEAVPGPRLGVDVTFFCCIVASWIWHRVHGLLAPDGWGATSR